MSFDRAWMWLAWALPRRLAYWCAIRVATHASRSMYDAEMPAITITDMLGRWDLPEPKP